MKRMAVKNAFQVLSIFYLVVTCFCSSLNVDTGVKGTMPSEVDANDSVSAMKAPVRTSLPEDIKTSSQSESLASNAASPKLMVDKKGAAHEQDAPPTITEAASEGTMPETQAVLPETPSSNDTDQDSTAATVPAVPASPTSSQSDATTSDVLKPTASEVPTVNATEAKPKSAAPTVSETQDKATAPNVDADNATKRRDRDAAAGESPEDGSDVPTFDEYQRKFTAGGGAAKEGAGGGSGGPGEGSSSGKDDPATGKEAGGHSGVSTGAKVGGGSRQQSFKNVGSQSCGAKVISHNGEASNPAYVLNENRDEYMNNPCAVKKWIVIETCEPVRLRKIEMASYELFSSMVKTFRVSSSERFPQKMWDVVGTFVAKNEKGVQTYSTEQDKYYKYFKFELVDHYGNEHFCPVSLIRLFGVLMEDDDGDDTADDSTGSADNDGVPGSGSEDDEAAAMVRLGKNKDPPSRSLLQSAKEVIVGIVKNTLRPSSKSTEGNEGEISATNGSMANASLSADNATAGSPTPTSRALAEELRVMHLMRLLLSGDYSSLLQRCLELLRQAPPVVHQQFVEHQIIPSPSVAYAACAKAVSRAPISAKELRWAYLTFNNDTFPWEDTGGSAAITAKLRDQVVPRETSKEIKGEEAPPPPPPPPPPTPLQPPQPEKLKPVQTTSVEQGTETKAGKSAENAPEVAVEHQDRPEEVKETAKGEENSGAGAKVADAAKEMEPKEKSPEIKETKEPSQTDPKQQQKEQHHASEAPPTEQHHAAEKTSTERSVPPTEVSKELEPDQPKQHQHSDQQSTQEQQQQSRQPTKATGSEGTSSGNGRGMGIKENAYMRLSNKVKDMERNITISMGYLEELSRSYKKKTDKLSKQLEKALTQLEEAQTQNDKQETRIVELEAHVKALTADFESKGVVELRKEHERLRKEVLVQALTLNLILIVAHLLVFFLCKRRSRHPSVVALNGASACTRSWRQPDSSSDTQMRADFRSVPLSHSNSEGNLCIVDPPFRFEDHLVKKDSKKRKKKKRSSNAGQPDRSSSASRIEQLVCDDVKVSF